MRATPASSDRFPEAADRAPAREATAIESATVEATAPTPLSRPVLGLLLAGCFLVLGAVVAAPWAAAQGSWLAGWLYLPFVPVCHQNPERSFHLFGHALAVCHRCSGLYGGFTLGLLVLPFLGSVRRFLFDHPRLLLVAALPMALDVFLWQNVPWSRVATGLVAAFPFGIFVWAAGTQLAQRHRTLEDSA